MRRALGIVSIIFFFSTDLIYGQKNPDLARTPPMGWNSWNWFGKKEINENI